MFETYIPGFSNMLMNSDMLTFQPELTGGGPAYTTITPDFMPEPAEGPAPAAMTPQEEFQARVRQIEAMVPGMQAAQPPSIMPSPSAPPMMSAPDFGALNIGGGAAFAPSFSDELFRSQLLNSDAGLTGGGPAYVDIMPGQALPYDGEPMAQPSMVPGAQGAQPPSIMPSPSAPPMMSAPSTYIPGFTNMLMRPDLLEGGPAYADMMPGTMGGAIDQVSMLPFAPEAPPPSSLMPPPAATTPRDLLAEDIFLGDGVRDVAIDPAMRGIYGAGSEASLAAPGLGQFQLSNEMIRNALSTMPGAARAAPSPYVRPTLNPSLGFQTQGDQQGYFFVTNRGRAAKTKDNPSAFVAVNPNAQYRLVNERSKNAIAASGVGEAGLQSAYQTAQRLSKEQGKKADWRLEVFDPAVGRWVVKADDDPSKNIFGKIASVALPIGAAILTGGASIPIKIAAGAAASGLGAAAAGRDPLKGAILGGLTAGGGALGGKLGAAGKLGALGGAKTGAVVGSGLGATAGGLATGQSLGQALQGGALAGAGTFVGQQALSGLRDLGVTIPGVNVPKTFTPGDIVVTAPSGGISIPVPTGMGGGSGKPQAPEPEPGSGGLDDAGIDVTANRIKFGALPMFGAGLPVVVPGGLPMTPVEAARQQELDQQQEQEPITVTTGRNLVNLGAAATPFAASPADTPTTTSDNVIEVTAQRAKEAPPAVTGALPATETPNTPEDIAKEFDKEFKDKRVTLEDIYKYLQAAGLLSSLLGGGGGRRGVGTIPAGFGTGFSSVFSGSLPRATLPGASTGFAPRPASTLRPQTTQDYYRYGYGPSQSFFSYVPEGERNLSQAYTGYAHGGMAEGGEMFAVNGPGTGRSDEIPAMLSDGEYVIDAETVALLGDGSSKAGAERLDQFRINVRRDKGRKLAKGEFSVNAKRPEHYLKGGRA